MISTRIILCIALPVLLAACATTPEEERKPEPPSMDEMLARLTEQQSKNCILFRDIERHKVVDEGVISVSMRRGNHFLVTTAIRCNFLRNSNGTLVSDGWGTLCRGSGTIADLDFDRTCPVKSIYEFPSAEAAMATLKAAQARREALALIPEDEQ